MLTTRSQLITLLSLMLLTLPAGAQRMRCGTPERVPMPPGFSGSPSDCGYDTNSPQAQYDPTFFYDIPVVFHVIQDNSGDGYLSPETIQDQIDILNEDFQALPGSLGAPGTAGKIRFHLATVDPAGNPTAGITYSMNNNWFQDSGNYWDPLAWDTNRYMNIYTNAVPCCYGYAYVPQSGGVVGQSIDRIVLWWEAVGRDPTAGWPGNTGRTATHEAGHALGLWHTFDSGCGSASCYTTGDLICDTNDESTATHGCPGSKNSCGNSDPINNYMDYTDDVCMWEFTPEQVNRMRCTLENWRPDVFVSVTPQETVRLGNPPNPNALLPGQTSGPVAAAVWDPVVDHGSFVPGAVVDYLILSLSSVEIPLGPKGTLLCGAPFFLVIPNLQPGNPYAIPVPNDGSLLGIGFCAQAASSAGGAQFRLTNALDCTIGN